MDIVASLMDCRKFFDSGITRPYAFRKAQLQKLRDAILQHEDEIYAALYSDLKKSPEECWVTENGMALAEINYCLSHLHQWMQPEKKSTNLLNFGSSSYVYKEPLGVVLIIGPWNYPFQLMIKPLVGAIAAGNVAVLKPSEFAPATAALLKKMMAAIFEPQYVLWIEGDGAEMVTAMMNNFAFDHVFFTGSTPVGKAVYQMAAQHLTPVTLELGGKSPCIVEADADIKVAAKRIVVTKFSNTGQMCIAPDYILVHQSVKEKLVAALIDMIKSFYGANAMESENFGKIINERQFNRLLTLMQHGTLAYGGNHSREQLFIEPTLFTDIRIEHPIMQQEIFGPLLPIISFSNKDEALQVVKEHKNPLAFYLFTSGRGNEKFWLEQVSFGGGCINNASYHFTNHHLPFGGRGASGMGKYHGWYSFQNFSHSKSVMKTPTWMDPAVKYPPFKGKLKLFKWVIR